MCIRDSPNTWQSITADVVDLTDIGASCTVSGGSDVVIAAGQSVPLAYSCTFASQPAYTGSNTATVTWDATAAHTATGTASGSAGVDFGDPTTESDRTITAVSYTHLDVYKRQLHLRAGVGADRHGHQHRVGELAGSRLCPCLLYTSRCV